VGPGPLRKKTGWEGKEGRIEKRGDKGRDGISYEKGGREMNIASS